MSTTLEKRWLALPVAITAFLLAFVLNAATGVPFAHADGSTLAAASLTAIDEQEPNDSFDTATKISMNQWVYGQGEATGYDYYEVNLPTSGSVTFTFVNDEYSGYFLHHASVTFYDKYYEFKAQETGFKFDTTKPHAFVVSLSAGINRIMVDASASSQSSHPYHFKLAYNVASTSITKVTSAKKKFTVKWTKKAGAANYQIRYSTKKNMSNAKTVTVSNKAGSKKVTKLKGKKKYYIQVRVVKTIGGQTYYSSWSPKKSITTKK